MGLLRRAQEACQTLSRDAMREWARRIKDFSNRIDTSFSTLYDLSLALISRQNFIDIQAEGPAYSRMMHHVTALVRLSLCGLVRFMAGCRKRRLHQGFVVLFFP